MTDQVLTCCDCSQQFMFRVDEQRFFQERGFVPPKRCHPCRRKRRVGRPGRRNLAGKHEQGKRMAP
ncbi:MAG: cytochrome C551 [Anaerolineae bacterium]|nr:cytochrome C551 [Anaerolineae bacterium]